MSHSSHLLHALKDPSFTKYQAEHTKRVLESWKDNKKQFRKFPRTYYHDEVVKDIQQWVKDVESDPAVEGDPAVIVPKLEEIIHDQEFPLEQRWWLLKTATEMTLEQDNNDTGARDHSLLLVKAVCKRAPRVAFEYQSQETEHDTFSKVSSFMHAVSRKNAAHVARLMLDCARESLPAGDMQSLLWRDDPDWRPLAKAMGTSDVEMLELLLSYEHDKAMVQRDILTYLESGPVRTNFDREKVVEAVVRKCPHLKNHVTMKAAIDSMIEHKSYYDPKIIDLLRTKDMFCGSESEAGQTARYLVQLNDKRFWGLMGSDEWSKCPSEWCLLHEAVKTRSEELVQTLSQKTNWVRKMDSDDKYPLWYISNAASKKAETWETTKLSEKSRRESGTTTRSAPDDLSRNLVGSTSMEREGSAPGETASVRTSSDPLETSRDGIRKIIVNRLTDLCTAREVKEIVNDSDAIIGEIALDLSDFKADSYSFTDFVESIKNSFPASNALPAPQSRSRSIPKRHLKFEETLAYVIIPSIPSEVNDITKKFDDINLILQWLRDKGVRRIIKLDILDRLWGSHSEKVISHWVQEFKVKKLHWRCQDLSFNFDADTFRRMESIHLYSSGKWAVESYWFGADGLNRFSKLASVEITIIEDLMEASDADAAERRIEGTITTFEEMRAGRASQLGIAQAPIEFSVRKERIQRPKQVEESHGLIYIGEKAIWELQPFLKGYRELNPSSKQVTKVAVLDNGIMLSAISRGFSGKDESEPHLLRPGPGSDMLERVEAGESFVFTEDGRQSSWLVPLDSHGTQMANLICATDPLCKLYVAKVGEYRKLPNVDAVVKAINWAVAQQVDVISMSFAIFDRTEKLTTAIKAAHDANIVLLASSHDEGMSQHEAWPASYTETITIAASDRWGTVLPRTPAKGHYQYRITGSDVFAGSVPFMQSETTISGSSVSTAIGAGLASLILCCQALYEERFPEASTLRVWKQRLVKMFFDRMSKDTKDKFIDLETFCGMKLQKIQLSSTTLSMNETKAMKEITRWFAKSDDEKQKLRMPRTP